MDYPNPPSYTSKKEQVIGVIFLIIIPLSLGIPYISAYFIDHFALDFDILLQAIILLGLSFICFGIDYFYIRSEKY